MVSHVPNLSEKAMLSVSEASDSIHTNDNYHKKLTLYI